MDIAQACASMAHVPALHGAGAFAVLWCRRSLFCRVFVGTCFLQSEGVGVVEQIELALRDSLELSDPAQEVITCCTIQLNSGFLTLFISNEKHLSGAHAGAAHASAGAGVAKKVRRAPGQAWYRSNYCHT